MNKKRFLLLLCLSFLLVLINGCSKKVPDDLGTVESESEGETESSSELVSTELFSLEGLPPCANDLLNLWRKTDDEVFEHMNNQEWKEIEPIESNLSTIYYVNGTYPGDPTRVITDGSIDYLGGKWGLRLDFGAEEPDPTHEMVWGLGYIQYETVVDNTKEAVALMEAIISQFRKSIKEPMEIGMNGVGGTNSNYLIYEDKEETVETLPRGHALFVVWDITPEGAAGGVYYRLLVLLSPYYDKKRTTQLGYSLRIRIYNTTFENWL